MVEGTSLALFFRQEGIKPQRMGTSSRGLQQLGWTDGHNVRIDIRAGAGEECQDIFQIVALHPSRPVDIVIQVDLLGTRISIDKFSRPWPTT